MSEGDAAPAAEPEVLDPAEEARSLVPAGQEALTERGLIPSRNYVQAVEMGKVLAASGYFSDARDAAKAAVKVMIGMDMGVSPTAAMSAIHIIESDGRMVPLVEGKLLGGIIKRAPGYDYEIEEYSEDKVTLIFLRDGAALEPKISWTKEDTKRAGLENKKNHKSYPRQMNFWRAMAEGVRMHFPELIGGQPIYAQEEFGDGDDAISKALEPSRPAPLADEKAEELRATARAIYDGLKEINPERVPPGRFASMVSNAEHSHQQLENLVEALEGLRDSEQRVADLAAEIEPLIPAAALKSLTERVERLGSNQERTEALEKALAEAKGESTTKEESNGSSDEPQPEG